MGEDGGEGEVTLLLNRWGRGDEAAGEKLLELVYGELRRLASAALRRERAGHTLQTTDLVHEAYLKLLASALPTFEDRRHFYGIAARAMRQLLVDHARAYARSKRLEPGLRAPLDDALHTVSAGGGAEVLAVHDALDRLAAEHAEYARIVELRYFGGYSLDATAEILGSSRATVARRWSLARALLQELLGASEGDA